MAYLDNTVITVDAVLTKKGRERLGQGRDAFNITKFAVSDDEIDYSLYNTAHPLGSTYYSNIIESMPVLEAIPDESQTMRYKLTSMNVGLKRLPILAGAGVQTSITLDSLTETHTISPKTIVHATAGGTIDPSATLDSIQGYTVILFDEEAARVQIDQGLPAAANYKNSSNVTVNPLINFSSTVVKAGFIFTIIPKEVTAQRNTKITIFGNESGVTRTMTLTINPTT
jgi:hypothetical protein